MKIVKLSLLLLLNSVFISTIEAQEYIDVLEPVHLVSAPRKAIQASQLITLNNSLITKKLSFKKEISDAKNNTTHLVIYTNDAIVLIDKVIYLKVVRKAANRSETVEEFVTILTKHLPVLKSPLSKYSSMDLLYKKTREVTFNGRLSQVPTSIQWL